MMKTIKMVVLFSCLLITGPVLAAVKLPGVFSNNMVLQRDRSVPVWGWSKPGESVTLSFAGQNKTTTAGADGKWRMVLDPLAASKSPQELVVKGENELVVKNVLVGEVWICSGQQNMAFNVGRCLNFEQEKGGATNSMIRLLRQQDGNDSLPQEDSPAAAWIVCEPGTVGNFAAIGYFFAREISRECDVPVGLLSACCGGTIIEPWICAEGYRLVPELEYIRKRVDEGLPNTDLGQPRYQAYLSQLKAWLLVAEAATSAKQMIPVAPVPPWAGDDPQGPTKQFNFKLAPLVQYSIRGALWCEGEGSAHHGELRYSSMMMALIGGWRQVWGPPPSQGSGVPWSDFPFYYVQLANFNAPDSKGDSPGGGGKFVSIREAQRKSLAITNTGMAVTIDIGDASDMLAKNKQDVGKRLALWALAKEYQKPVVYSGPLYQRCQVEGNKIRLHFDYAQGGLIVGQKAGLEPVKEVKEGKLACFAIAGKDTKFYWAEAVIDGQTVVVSSDKVAEPVAVRYAFVNNPEGLKLYNKAGLPASPFRTDNW